MPYSAGSSGSAKATRALFDNSDFNPYEEQSMMISGSCPGVARECSWHLLPQVPIATDTAQWYRLTTRTEPASFSNNLAEGAVYPEGTFEYDRESAPLLRVVGLCL